MTADINTVKNIASEAGVISTLLHHPEFYYSSEFLQPRHFFNIENGIIYYAITELIKQNVYNIDAYNIMAMLTSNERTRQHAKNITERQLQELVADSITICRNTVDEYKIVAKNVIDKAQRRDIYNKLRSCESLCFSEDDEDIQSKVYTVLDDVMNSYNQLTSVVEMKDRIDEVWARIVERQSDEFSGINFKFPSLNNYCQIMRQELFIVGAQTKIGKSVFLLNCLVDLLKNNIKVLYIDSELSTETFTMRLITHLTKIPFKIIQTGGYTSDQARKIDEAIKWIKSKHFVHEYMPIFDNNKIIMTVKKARATMGLDALIVDYFKNQSDGDAFEIYNKMGKTVDMIKNECCGAMNLMGLGAVQLTANNKVADSAKIARNASTLVILDRKTPEQIAEDGYDCGNSWLRVALNRNGPQMAEGEYIDLSFNGDLVSYEECKQHKQQLPY